MKRFLVYLLVIVVTVSFGFGIFYLVRDNELISISDTSLYKDVNDNFTIKLNRQHKKNSTKVETAPISAFITMILLAFLFMIMKCQLSVMTFLSRYTIFAFLFAFGLLFSLLSVFSSFDTDTSFRLHAIPIAMRLNTISNVYAFL